MNICKNCDWDKPMTAWGETFNACYYNTENLEPLWWHENTKCSGYKDKELAREEKKDE